MIIRTNLAILEGVRLLWSGQIDRLAPESLLTIRTWRRAKATLAPEEPPDYPSGRLGEAGPPAW